MQAELLPYYEYLGPAKVKCKTCGAEMDTRGGRAKTHLKSHGVSSEATPKPERKADRVERVAEVEQVAPVEAASAFVRGSREWSVEKILTVMDNPASTSEQVLKAADLLKEYQDFGTKRLDDEKEAASSAAQWDRVFVRVAELKKAEEKLLKDPDVRVRLKAALEAVK